MLFLRTSSLQGEKILFSLKLMLLKMFLPLLRKLFGPPGLACCPLVLQGRRTPCTTAMAKNITTITSTTTLIALICFLYLSKPGRTIIDEGGGLVGVLMGINMTMGLC